MLSVLSVALLILLYLSAHEVQAANFTSSSTGQNAANFTSSSTGQNVKLLIEQAITSLNSGDAKAALSNLTLADKLLG
ncbi:hypothetical protein [Nitrososphaera sp. AFS]|jgi:hypothetical protein|uniref:hypothetical protein n=1 Tax=Nitrososphaera sp. AFS TaxID=2301191 RepID=UPI0013921EF8|nr:hypothetical protein [Nitrososphaera sp. AFS]NAL77438.1 hypothetical protein [Nitrososphaera sp. AFS]